MAARTAWIVMHSQEWDALSLDITQQPLRLVGPNVPDRWMPLYFDKERAETDYPGAPLLECELPGIEEHEPNSEEE